MGFVRKPGQYCKRGEAYTRIKGAGSFGGQYVKPAPQPAEKASVIRRRCTELALVLHAIADGDVLWQIRQIGDEKAPIDELDLGVTAELVSLGLALVSDGPVEVVEFTPEGHLLWLSIRGLLT